MSLASSFDAISPSINGEQPTNGIPSRRSVRSSSMPRESANVKPWRFRHTAPVALAAATTRRASSTHAPSNLPSRPMVTAVAGPGAVIRSNDDTPLTEPPVEHVELTLDLHRKPIDRIFDFDRRVGVEVPKAAPQIRGASRLPEQPLVDGGRHARANVGRRATGGGDSRRCVRSGIGSDRCSNHRGDSGILAARGPGRCRRDGASVGVDPQLIAVRGILLTMSAQADIPTDPAQVRPLTVGSRAPA